LLLLIIIASAIATPVVWLIMSRWLQDFAYRINVSWWSPLAAGVAALTIAMSIIIFQAIKAAVANPVKSLRTE
jgi:putative ABC transport system permease protein